jgi:hypothetical protein
MGDHVGGRWGLMMSNIVFVFGAILDCEKVLVFLIGL